MNIISLFYGSTQKKAKAKCSGLRRNSLRRFVNLLVVLSSGFIIAACSTQPSIEGLPYASAVSVHKAERVLYLHDENGAVYRTYKIALGGDPVGHKQFEGDYKTPEGLYYIETRNPNSKYHLSLKISYPNEQDRAYAESQSMSPGGDIFIHGVPNEKNALEKYFYRFKEQWTQGCIALTNKDMEDLWSLVGDGTPIMIYP